MNSLSHCGAHPHNFGKEIGNKTNGSLKRKDGKMVCYPSSSPTPPGNLSRKYENKLRKYFTNVFLPSTGLNLIHRNYKKYSSFS